MPLTPRLRAARLLSVSIAASVAFTLVLGSPPAGAEDVRSAQAPRLGSAQQPSAATDAFRSSSVGHKAPIAPLHANDRASVVRAYQDVYLPAAAVRAPEVDPDAVTDCVAGSPSVELQSATLSLVNYFRDLSGVDAVTFDDTLSAKAQQASLIMYANGALNHTPPESWTCYTDDGAEAAGSSNLALGYAGADVVKGYMDDPGAGNVEAGHRWWLQRPGITTMGNGTVGSANALWVVGPEAASTTPTYLSWPSAGYFPAQLEPAGRWSFTAPNSGYDLRQATVDVLDEQGAPVTVQAHPVGQFGSLVFELGAVTQPTSGSTDTYTVTVSNIQVDGSVVDPYTYTVDIFDPTEPGADPLTFVSKPVVTGLAEVGGTLTTTAPTWSEGGVTTTYQWLRDGNEIAGADSDHYLVSTADVGATISVRTTGQKDGRSPVSVESAPIAVRVPVVLSTEAFSSARGRLQIDISVAASEDVSGGTVSIAEGGQRVGDVLTVVDGRARLSAAGVTPGHHRYAVTYSGTDRLQSVTSEVQATVRSTTPAQLKLSGSSPAVGKVKLTIAVSAPGETAPAGTATVKRGSKVLTSALKVVKGKATFEAAKIASGRQTFTVVYSGTSRVASTSASLPVDIRAKVKSTMTLSGSSPGENQIKIGITVRSDAQSSLGGTATIKQGSKTVKAKLTIAKGKATFKAGKIKAGTHTYTVVYRGTSEVSGTEDSVKITVKAPVRLKSYASCEAMRRDYPHGVGRTDADDSTSGDPVTNFFRHNQLYSYNDGKSRHPGEKDLDRDNDDIACESH